MIKRLFKPFTDLSVAPRGLWFLIGAFVLESMAYFGVLTLMTTYLGEGLGWGDKNAGMAVSFFTMLVTLSMLGVGSMAEAFGLRRAVIFALVIITAGRVLYCLAPGFGMVFGAGAAICALFLIACGNGILQPVCYSGVKQYTDEKSSSMGYALIYAIMNLGIVGIGAMSSWVRPGVQKILDGKVEASAADPFLAALASHTRTGVEAVNWVCAGFTGLALLFFVILMTRRTEAAKLRPDEVHDNPTGPKPGIVERFRSYFSEGPFTNLRFLFFIFMLLPVRTLFAHQWLTMPQYILRSYPNQVGDKMEWLVNWINPLIIFFGVPVLTALTRKTNVYTMMMIGTLVSAAPTFLLCGGAKSDPADYLFRHLFYWRGTLVGAVPGVRQRVGAAGKSGAVHGVGECSLVAGQGDDRGVFGVLARDLLPAKNTAGTTADRHVVVHLRVHCDEFADRAMARSKMGAERPAPCGAESNGRTDRRGMRPMNLPTCIGNGIAEESRKAGTEIRS